MTIKPTQEMEDAFFSEDDDTCESAGCRNPGCFDVRLQKVLDIIDRDYVPRWGTLTQTVPRDALHSAEGLRYAKKDVQASAKHMGGTISDIDSFEIRELIFDYVELVWKVRRDS